MSSADTYSRLIALLESQGATYRIIDHAPEGRTDIVSSLRGHPASEAAKCIILIAKKGKKTSRFLLAVVPGHARVNTSAVKSWMDATYVGFAAAEVAERLSGCVAGTILPFSFSEELVVVADPSLKDREMIYFNAARLDRSVALRTADYIRIAEPKFADIAEMPCPG